MPLEKLMIAVFKDFFVNYLKLSISQEKEPKSTEDSTFIIVSFMTMINGEETPVYSHYSTKCIDKIYRGLMKTEEECEILREEGFSDFAKKITNILLKRLRKYIHTHDNRDVTLSVPMLCTQVEKTRFSIKRCFRIDGEYLIAEY